jgi:hypothetical protein
MHCAVELSTHFTLDTPPFFNTLHPANSHAATPLLCRLWRVLVGFGQSTHTHGHARQESWFRVLGIPCPVTDRF